MTHEKGRNRGPGHYTLRNYDPLPDNSVKIQGSLAISGSKAKKPTSQTISALAQVHNVATSSSMASTSTMLQDQK